MADKRREPRDEAKTKALVRRLWAAWLSGERYELDRLLNEDASLNSDNRAWADLVYAEFWLRKQVDSSVTESEYLLRFPHIAADLQVQFAMGKRLLADGGSELECDTDRTFRAAGSDSTATPFDATVELRESMAPDGFNPICLLGVGGMGVVIKALQVSLNREVAIKSLKSVEWVSRNNRERLLKEAHVVAQLKHTNVVQIYDVIEERGKLFLIMEFVPGTSLAKAHGGTPVDANLVAKYVLSIAAAIRAAHEIGFLHRDIKPTNVLLSDSGEIKVTDFGLARATEESSISLTGEVLGTAAYMAPEQILGKRSTVNVRADVYGIGATLYELLTGRPPFVGSSTAETLQQSLHAEPIPPKRLVPAIPKDLESICLRCLEKQPEKRYASVADLHEDVERFIGGQPTRARPVTRLEKSRRWIGRNPGQFVAIVTLALSMLTLMIATTWYVTRISFLESVGKSRDEALRQAYKRDELNAYFSLASSIQSRIADRNNGWTWENQRDIQKAVVLVPSEDEKRHLRELLIQTMQGFDLRKRAIIASSIDPFGIAWAPDEQHFVVGENVTRTLENQDEAYVLYVFGPWPERPFREILLPAIEPEKIAAGFVEGIRSLVFLNDNRSLVVGCRSGWIQVVDIDSSEVISKWKAHQDWCYALAYDSQRDWIASASRDGSIFIWDTKSKKRVASYQAAGAVKYVEILSDRLVTLGAEREQFALPNHDQPLLSPQLDSTYSSMHLMKDRNMLLLASNRRVSLIDIPTNESFDFLLKRSPFSRSANVSHIDKSSHGNWVAVSGIESVLFLDVCSRKETMSMPIPGSGAKYVTFDRLGDVLWVANNNRLMRFDLHPPEIWRTTPIVARQSSRTAKSQLPATFFPHFDEGSAFIVVDSVRAPEHPSRARILIDNVPPASTAIEQLFLAVDTGLKNISEEEFGVGDSEISLWDASASKLRTIFTGLPRAGWRSQTAFGLSRDGKRYWVGDSVDKVGRLQVINVADGSLINSRVYTESAKRIRVSGLEDIVCGEQRTLALSDDHTLSLFDSDTCNLHKVIELGKETIPKTAALSHDEQLAFVGAQEGHLLWVDLVSDQVELLSQGTSEVTALACSPDGVLAVGLHSGDIDLWSIASKPARYMGRLAKFDNSINLLEYSQDGKQLAVLVQGEQAGRLLDWNTFRARLADFNLDWDDEYFSPPLQR